MHSTPYKRPSGPGCSPLYFLYTSPTVPLPPSPCTTNIVGSSKARRKRPSLLRSGITDFYHHLSHQEMRRVLHPHPPETNPASLPTFPSNTPNSIMATDDDADYCPGCPESSASSQLDGTNVIETTRVVPAPPVQVVVDVSGLEAHASTNQPPGTVTLAARPPVRNLHSGWDPTSIAMAKCDMCSRAGCGVVYKCSQCKLSVCKECCEGGKLNGDSRHDLDPTSVSWDPPPKERRASTGGRGRGRGRASTSRANRGRLARRERKGTRDCDPSHISTDFITLASVTDSPAMGKPSNYAAMGRESSRDRTASFHDRDIDMDNRSPRMHRPNHTPASHHQTCAYEGNTAVGGPAAVRPGAISQEEHPDGPHMPTIRPRSGTRGWRALREGRPYLPPLPDRDLEQHQGRRRASHYLPYELPMHPPGPDNPYLLNRPLSPANVARRYSLAANEANNNHRPSLEPRHGPSGPQNQIPHESSIGTPGRLTWRQGQLCEQYAQLRDPPDQLRVQRGQPRGRQAELESHVENLSFCLFENINWAYRANPTIPLDLCLREELISLWENHLLPDYEAGNIEEAFRTLLAASYRTTTQLGLDPMRNAARDWICRTEKQLCEEGYDPLGSIMGSVILGRR